MPGFVWLKTITGTRTAGFFALRASGDKLYTSNGTSLDPPPSGVMISGDELSTAISKSATKGMYVNMWNETKDEWYQYLHGSWNEHLGVYFTMDDAITKIAGAAGILTPRNSSKDVVAEKRAGAMARKKQIELEFKDGIRKSLQLLKPETVSARRIGSSLDPMMARTHLTH